MSFYTNVKQYGNQLLIREVDSHGNHRQFKEKYKPYLFVSDNENMTESEYKNIFGKKVSKLNFDSIKDAKNFIEQYKNVYGFDIYGMDEFAYPFLNDRYNNEYEFDHINVISIDIETKTDNGFPVPDLANEEITVITISKNGKYIVIGNGDYKVHKENITYINCSDEKILLQTFVNEFAKMNPDILTGWNINQFDVPYLVNRITKVIGVEWAKKLSPWGILVEKNVKGKFNNEFVSFDIYGIAILDYLELYKKWTFVTRESYKLDHIGEIELDEKKLDYSDYGSLENLWKNDYQKYVEYNIRDTELINMLEEKLRLISLVVNIAYQAKINYTDTFSRVKIWDVIIHNRLMSNKIVVPFNKREISNLDDEYIGGYVKEPIPAMYKWVVSFDLDSLYPHIIMQYNISFEKFRGKYGRELGNLEIAKNLTIENILDNGLSEKEIREFLSEGNFGICANKTLWDNNKQGFLPELMESYYKERKEFKKKSIENKKLFEETHEKKYLKLSDLYNTTQLARKLMLNSAYGALGCKFFRWYNIEFAEAITSSGQLIIKYFSKRINEHLNAIAGSKDVDYVIANDTDSGYLNLENVVKKYQNGKSTEEIVNFLDKMAEKDIEPFLSKIFNELKNYTNAFQQKMHMKREAISIKGLWTGKKHYILNVLDLEGVRYSEPKIKIVGIEAIKSSTPAICRQKIKDAIKIIMNGENDELLEFNEKFKFEFKKLKLEEIAFPRGLNKMEDYYDEKNGWKLKTPIHLRGSFVYNNLLKKYKLLNKYPVLKTGDKIKFCYLFEPNEINSNVISCADEMPKEFDFIRQYVDYETQFFKAYLKPLIAITDVIDWDVEYHDSLF